MLTRLAILNSHVYGRAEIKFDDCGSIQLVGPNNVGKSTLIYALNFLYVIDGSKMYFSGNRKGDKETIHHYFPTINQSYIVFEFFKQQYYSILLKRDTQGDLEYYYMNHAYDHEFFFEHTKEGQRLRKFEELLTLLQEKNIELKKFANKTEVFNQIYARDKKSNAAVWLEETVKSDGLTNNFSKVYRYLINSKLITNKTLKECLVIADNRDNESISFSQKNKKDISDLLRINDEIKAVKAVQNDFSHFREVVDKYKAKSRLLSELVYAFNNNYGATIESLGEQKRDRDKEFNRHTIYYNETLKPQHEQLNRNIGAKDVEVSLKEAEVTLAKNELTEISAYEGLAFLKESRSNLDKQRKDLEAMLTRLDNSQLSIETIEFKLNKLNKQHANVSRLVENFSDQLIHHVAKKQGDRQLLYSILSPDFAGLSADLIKKQISKTEKTIKLFDGEIKLPADFELKDLPSLPDLQAEQVELEREIREYEKLAEISRTKQDATKRLEEATVKIAEINKKVEKLNNLSLYQKQYDFAKSQLSSLIEERNELQKKMSALYGEIGEVENKIEEIRQNRGKIEQRIINLHNWKAQLDTFDINPSIYESKDSPEVLYNRIVALNTDRLELKASKDRSFENLKNRTNTSFADEDTFIRFIDEELACLDDKERSIDGLLQNVSAQFANPAFNLIKRYEDFKAFVYTKFNHSISKTKISNIRSLQVELKDNVKKIEELRKISQIQENRGQMNLGFDQTENLKLLNHYLETNKQINFEELFDIELQLDVAGTLKKVDLKEQVESDGTDRMIRLVMIMSVINRLAVNSDKNKIVLFIDEVGTIDEQNRPELVNFCNEHNFIPIFAAPQPYNGFDKYYILVRGKGKINVNEQQHVITKATA